MEAQTVENVEGAAIYFPLMNGRYEVKPGMVSLGADFGNGEADKQVFQIGLDFADYRRAKLLARGERLSKYYQTYDYTQPVAGAIACLIMERLVEEHPQYFNWEQTANTRKFHSYLTQETLYLNADWELQQVSTPDNLVFPAYASTLDALAAQIPEDVTVICRRVDGSNWLSAVHLCYPNHWSAEEKIGRDFAVIHEPVAGMEKINRRAGAIVNTMIDRKPMVRFAWGLSTDTRLNHHPQPPQNILASQWQGRKFDLQSPQLYLRIERQVIWGLPEYDAALFTIRTYFRDCQIIKQNTVLRSKLYSAVERMTAESLIYKGLAESRDNILRWLR